MAKKKKGKKKKVDQPPKTTKTEYLNRIAENNAILARERKKADSVQECYFNNEKKYEQVQEDMADTIKYLQHEIEVNESEIEHFNEKTANLNKELTQTHKHYQAIFNKMEAEYEEKNKELEHQLQQVQARLCASEETKQLREDYLKKKEELELSVKEMEIRQEKEIYEAEKLAIIKQDTMQKSMEINLTSLMVDFKQASDLAIGETINKLVKDNIALGNMLTCMQETIESARASYHKTHTEETNFKYNADLIEAEHKLIRRRNEKRNLTIEVLIKTQEDLYERIKNCQKLIKNNRRLQRQIIEEECILKEKWEDVRHLQKTLNESEKKLNIVEEVYNKLRQEIIKIQILIIEAATKVKEAIDVENITTIEDENINIQDMDNKEEAEEILLDYKFKVRENAIDYVLNKLSNESITDPESQMFPLTSDLFLEKNQESIA